VKSYALILVVIAVILIVMMGVSDSLASVTHKLVAETYQMAS
jgi:Flp pilus assembly pilin Flp